MILRWRVACILLWSLLPCLALWVGLYLLKSAVWTFLLYHGVCLAPVLVLKRSLWLPTARFPAIKQVVILLLASILFSLAAHLGYLKLGQKILSNDAVFDLLVQLGYCKQLFWPLSAYVVVVNPVLEEIYWRGIVLNELEQELSGRFKIFALLWSSFAYGLFHYLIVRLVVFPGYAIITTVLLAIYGAMMAMIYRKSGSIITTAVAHGLLTDLAAVVLLLDLLRLYPAIL